MAQYRDEHYNFKQKQESGKRKMFRKLYGKEILLEHVGNGVLELVVGFSIRIS